jgi:hypothetical protein
LASTAPGGSGGDHGDDPGHYENFFVGRVIVRFDGFTGFYPYHCHILEHEDHEMMRQFKTVCYHDCNEDQAYSVADFGCFQTKFVPGSPYADCNADRQLTVADFGCFQTKFVVGCP